jgi:type I restriction enzyme M protein
LKHNIGEALNTAAEAIEEHNSSLEGVLVTIDFNIKNKLSDKKLQDLLSHFSQHRLRNADFERPDMLGTAYEYLIKMFADSAGKKGGEFYTPSEVVQLLVALLKPHAGMRIYDPTSGSGGMLVQMRNHLADHGENAANLSLFGQEMNLNTWAICKMNMFLHGVHNADIRKGDTLRDPKHTLGGELMHFDRVIANPPFSLSKWGKEECDNDGFGRFPYGTPPKDAGDLAFVQHMIASTNNDGMVGVVMPHGVLFRGSSEKAIRQGILEDDLLEAVVGLPAGLFYGTGIPACLLIINKQKPAARKGKVLFINSELEYQEGKNQNKLREQDIAKIVDTFESHSFESKSDTKRYSKVVELSEIADNDYNLNIRRYADTSPPAEIFDVRAILHGGIPVREVENTYIRDEILKGFDVSCVFTPRYSLEGGNPQSFDYYDFKAEIDTKEKIRSLVESSLEASLVTADLDATDQASATAPALGENESASATALVLAQLERWWDKYHVSLHQLDAEVLTAEQVMQGYLKELGYAVHDCKDAGGRVPSGMVAEDSQVPRANGCAGAAE